MWANDFFFRNIRFNIHVNRKGLNNFVTLFPATPPPPKKNQDTIKNRIKPEPYHSM